MNDITPQNPIMTPPQNDLREHPHFRPVALFLLVAVIGVLALLYLRSIQQQTISEISNDPLAELKALEDSSAPVSASVKQRSEQLDALSKMSQPVTLTREERLKELESLHEQ